MKESESPCVCPSCQSNLHGRGAVIAWTELPERFVGHLEPGERDGVILIIDATPQIPEIGLQCSDCGANLSFTVEDKYLDPEVEIHENESDNDFTGVVSSPNSQLEPAKGRRIG